MKLPQLHLRDLFWLVLVAGLSLGWAADSGLLGPDFWTSSNWASKRQLRAQVHTLKTTLEAQGWVVKLNGDRIEVSAAKAKAQKVP